MAKPLDLNEQIQKQHVRKIHKKKLNHGSLLEDAWIMIEKIYILVVIFTALNQANNTPKQILPIYTNINNHSSPQTCAERKTVVDTKPAFPTRNLQRTTTIFL